MEDGRQNPNEAQLHDDYYRHLNENQGTLEECGTRRVVVLSICGQSQVVLRIHIHPANLGRWPQGSTTVWDQEALEGHNRRKPPR